jgi:hypothetical protein
MGRRFLPSIRHSGTRLLHRVDSAAYRINPYLLALAVGLIMLNVTFFIGMKVSPPRPAGSVQLTTTP